MVDPKDTEPSPPPEGCDFIAWPQPLEETLEFLDPEVRVDVAPEIPPPSGY